MKKMGRHRKKVITVGYYDNVKDSVRGDNGSGGSSFDTLKEAAEESSEEEKEGDDTSIEVLEEGLDEKSGSKESGDRSEVERENTENQDTVKGKEEIGLEGVESRLDKIIEQNNKIIEVLESFGNS